MRPPSMRASASAALPSNVNLYCNQCDSQIGIFSNEFIRLTSSYARAKERGTHFATEAGNRTQIVPSGPTQKAAEGCEMSEVFCKKCSSTVGQYCRSAPDEDKQYLVDNHFYKLSRVYLKDVQTFENVEPSFGFDDDAVRATGRRTSLVPPSRWSRTPTSKEKVSARPRSASRQPLQSGVDHTDDTPKENSHRFFRSNTTARHSVQPDGNDTYRAQQREGSVFFQHAYTPSRVGTPFDGPSVYPTYPPHAGPYQQPAGYFHNLGNGYHMSSAPPIVYSLTPAPQYIAQSACRESVPPPTHSLNPLADSSDVNTQIHYPSIPVRFAASSVDPIATAISMPAKSEVAGDATSSESSELTSQRFAKQDAKIKEQTAKLTVLGDKVEYLHVEMEKVRAILEELRTDASLQQSGKLPSSEIDGNFEKMWKVMKSSNMEQEELQALRTENEAMKIKLDTIASAINPVQILSPVTSAPSSTSNLDLSSILGKRKRGTIERRSSLQHEMAASDIEEDDLPSAKLGGKSRSVHGTLCSGSNSRTSEVEDDTLFIPGSDPVLDLHDEKLGESRVESVLAEAETVEVDNPDEDSNVILEQPLNLHEVPQDEEITEADSLTEATSLLPDSVDFSDDEPAASDVVGKADDVVLTQGASGLRLVATPSESVGVPRPEQQQAVPTQELATNSKKQQSQQSKAPPEQQPARVAELEYTPEAVIRDPTLALDDRPSSSDSQLTSLLSQPRMKGRRATDGVLDTRSMAPEPPKRRRRVTADRAPKLIDLESAYVATPEMIAQKILNKGKPRIPKPKLQTTEKMLNKELKELGLEYWIGKDKTSTEYKEVVDSARMRRREESRMKTLAEKGIVSGSDSGIGQQTTVFHSQPVINRASRGSAEIHAAAPDSGAGPVLPKPASLPQPFPSPQTGSLTKSAAQMKTRAPVRTATPLASVAINVAPSSSTKATKDAAKANLQSGSKSTFKSKPRAASKSTPIPPSTPDPPSTGVQTRRQQQVEQIKRRDQLAKEAMERDEMGVAD